ncbi:MAG: carboxypeptidase-like regulatory domain-containing protein [Bacteroidetes bacterium]|nr:carboxypeptidase-like regulatory domain-containing protein [Bacteroidota bacterium]
MKIKLYLTLLFVLAGSCMYAQTLLKGVVTESGTGAKMPNVFVHDNNNKEVTLTDKSGRFEINTEPGHTLIFSSPGYVSDTLYIVDLTQKHIQLTVQAIALRGVSITATRQANFDPHKEYPEVYEKAKLYPLSPSTWFGRDAKNARRMKRFFKTEEQERAVDRVFTRAYVSSIIPLKGQALEDFMALYRPSYAFITSNDAVSMAAYINDSYKKFMALPPDKRHLQPLTSDQPVKP